MKRATNASNKTSSAGDTCCGARSSLLIQRSVSSSPKRSAVRLLKIHVLTKMERNAADSPGSRGYRHPSRLAPRLAGIDSLVAELLLDPHELVVLGVAIRAAWCSSLDLASAESNSQVCDSRVLG